MISNAHQEQIVNHSESPQNQAKDRQLVVKIQEASDLAYNDDEFKNTTTGEKNILGIYDEIPRMFFS